MITRNSLKSVLRSPVKSILFFILLLSLTTALTLGSALVSMCGMLINECGKTYVTEASLEYRGGRFPFRAVTDDNAKALRDGIDFKAISELPFVEKVDRNPAVSVFFDTYKRSLTDSVSKNAFIGVVRKQGTADKAVKVIYANSIVDHSSVRLSPDFGEEGRYYLISGFTDGSEYGVVGITVGSVLNGPGLLCENQGYSWIDVTDDRNLSNGDPRYEFFFRAAESYRVINKSIYCIVSEDPGFHESFVENEFSFSEGGLYTAEDIKNGPCCIIPGYLAGNMGIKAGDRITLAVTGTDYKPLIDSYWKTKDGEDSLIYVDCLVTGIFSTTSDERPLPYLSGLGDYIKTENIEGFCGYTLGTLKLRNGVGAKDVAKIKALVPEGVEISVKDQGYSVIVGMLKKLMLSALGITLAALLATVSMLVLFGYVFVGRQSDTLVTMYMMGTPMKSLFAYVLIAAGVILVPAGIAGFAAAMRFSDSLVSIIEESLKSGESVMRLYSNASLGTFNMIKVDVTMPTWPGIVSAAAVFLCGIGSCLLFMKKAVSRIGAKEKQGRNEKNKKTKAPLNAKPLNIRGAGLKYLILSFIRGGLRTLALILIGVLMTLSILLPAGAITRYENKLKELNENTVIKGYLTDYAGKLSSGLVLYESMIDRLSECVYLDDFHFSMNDSYRLYSVERKNGDGEWTTEVVAEKEIPEDGGFSYENFVTNLLNGPKIYYTDSIAYTPEFITSGFPEIEYLEGFDDSWFTEDEEPFEDVIRPVYGSSNLWPIGKDVRELYCLVPRSFLEKYGLRLGDKITIDVSEDVVRETYTIIGSFRAVGNGATVYTRIYNAYKVINTGRGSVDILYAKIRKTFSTCAFRVTDTKYLKDVKEWLRDKGYSRVHTAGYYRIYPVLVDMEYNESVEKIEKNINYLKSVVPALALLSGIAGFTAAILMAFRRKVEIATLRSIGQKDVSVFFIFALEQVLPAAAGCAAGLGVYLIFAGLNGYSSFAAAFIAGFAAGSLISLLKMSKTNLLDVLSDKE